MKMNSIVKTILIAGIVAASGALAFAADDSGYALLLQSSPVDGGNITPGNGVHKVQIGGKMTLAAVPRAGYRFLYWVGDVGQIASSETSVEMSGPKMVVAVFAREGFEDLKKAGIIGGSATGGTYASPGAFSGSGRTGTAIDRSGFDFPVNPQAPEEDNGTLVPEVPEPATLLLLAFGAAALRAKRNKRLS